MKVTSRMELYRYLDNEYSDEFTVGLIGIYGLVTYDNVTRPIYLQNIYDGTPLYIELPCHLIKIGEYDEDNIKKYLKEISGYNSEEFINDYLDLYIRPMVRNNILYEIYSPKTFLSFLPREFEIQFKTESEILDWILEHEKDD